MFFVKPLGFLKPPLRIQALNDVSLKVFPGEVVAVVGESSGGKTTIGNVLTGILQPTLGRILFEGEDIAAMRRQSSLASGATLKSQLEFLWAVIAVALIHLAATVILVINRATEVQEVSQALFCLETPVLWLSLHLSLPRSSLLAIAAFNSVMAAFTVCVSFWYLVQWNVRRPIRKKLRAFRRQVQIVQQDAYAALNPVHTVAYSLATPLRRLGLVPSRKEAMKRVVELLELVELRPVSQYVNKYPHQLSGGQRQRILLARAISLGPKVIVADEPVSMIDVSLRVSALNLMRKLNRELNISFVYITHDLGTARYIGREGRLMVLYLGKIVETGGLRDVMGNPRHPYLQALLSSVPVPDPEISRHRRKINLVNVEMPSIINPPPGCRFHTRCPFAQALCKESEPLLRTVETSEVACHFAEKIPRWTIA